MTTFTTLEEIANEFTNENVKTLFIKSYKDFVELALKDGFSFAKANRIAFDILIKKGGLEKIAKAL